MQNQHPLREFLNALVDGVLATAGAAFLIAVIWFIAMLFAAMEGQLQ